MTFKERTIAASPFDALDADLVLRSSDNVDFLVSKVVMALASPVFADMFVVVEATSGRPRAATACGPDAPVADLTEHSRTLDCLLRLIYPVRNPRIERPEDALDVFQAASKYMVDHTAEDVLEQFATLAEKQPLQAYVQAYLHSTEIAMRIAARASLLYPWFEIAKDSHEFPSLSHTALIRLQEYHAACGAAASSATLAAGVTTSVPEQKPWFPYTHTSEWRNHPQPRFYYAAHPWWREALGGLAKILRSTPHPQMTGTQRFFGTMLAKAAQASPGSKDALCSALLAFMEDYPGRVDHAVSEVRL
ncbi:uncharacterized protein PHACADRAFT_249826 [Phanerochaete carnosa HHB-10118-sp]|uniref:BTB domain-containing protein n=1 Tax=Phanerochaete carnosa (strain HHB-10118-sp) TaxID=650164 RepID=K5V990_PHACS|nr:uncharacterized protein PHACADRAFT_249826 [Phanerochaete carnosa HHB-10118-sp]EKM59376.1 hypothetical protein PHACADRAFT_249826 [Phanerochaete carnosa HHB-10118-sp]